MANSVADLACAFIIIALCDERRAYMIAALFVAASSMSTIATFIHLPKSYMVVYAHTLSIIGHAQNIALIWSASDGGIRNRLFDLIRFIRARPLAARHHSRRVDPDSHSEPESR